MTHPETDDETYRALLDLRHRNRIGAVVANVRLEEIDAYVDTLRAEDDADEADLMISVEHVRRALNQVVAALGGQQDPHVLGIARNRSAILRVQVILAGQDGT